MKAIRLESVKSGRESTRQLMDQLPLGRVMIGGPAAPLGTGMRPIDEQEPVLEPLSKGPGDNGPKDGSPDVTWRERLGGFLHPRDMRKLVTPFSASNEPELIVRRHAMLLNFDPLRAIILRDRTIVLVPDGADSLLVQLEKRIRGEAHTEEGQSSGMVESDSTLSLNKLDRGNGFSDSIQETIDSDEDDDEIRGTLIDKEWAEIDAKEWIDLPFELQSVDAILSSVSSILADDVLDLQLGANSIISDLIQPDSDVGDHAQETLRTMKNSVQEMTSRVKGFNRALDAVLEDYEDMALMNLSRLLTHPERFVQPVSQAVLEEESDEPELILEAHMQRGHTLVNALTLVECQINSTEDFAVRKSDAIRNRLLYINMVISILSLAVTIGSFVGSMFGMNVVNYYEDSSSAFRVIAWSTVVGILLFATTILFVLRKLGALPNVFKKT